MLRRVASTLLIALGLYLQRADAQQNPTLAKVLEQESIAFAHAAVPHLNSTITGYATLNDDREFLIAYYLATPENDLRFPLFLLRLDKLKNQWQDRVLAGLRTNAFEGRADTLQAECLGSVLGIQSNGQRYYLNLHWTPSAGCLLVLNHDLSVDQMLAGWTVAFFKSGLLVYSGNMVHFADIHPETLFLYDPTAHKSLALYPPRIDRFRIDFGARLSKAIDTSQCAEMNRLCDPEIFTSSIVHPIEVNDETHSLAFRVQFETEGFALRQDAEVSGRFDDDQYVYIYQFAPVRWRAFSAYDLEPMFGTNSLKELLTPAKLQQVFATPRVTPSASRHSHSARAP